MGRKPVEPKDSKKFEKESAAKICKRCKMAVYQHHHQFPHKYYKCPTCGFTIEIKEVLNFRKPDEGKD